MANSLIVHRGIAGTPDDSTRFINLGGYLFNSTTTTEAKFDTPVRDAGTFSNLFVYVSANTASNTSTIKLQKSQVAGNPSVSIGGDQTGIFEDTTNTATFAATDEASFEIAVPAEAGNNTLTTQMIAIQFAPTTTTDCISFLVCDNVTSISHSTNSTTFYFVPNGLLLSSTVEADDKYRIRVSFTTSDFHTYVVTNARTTDTVFRTRVNGANGSQSVTYTSAQTGAKEDTVNTDSLVAGDDYNYSVTLGTGAGEIMNIAVVGTTAINTSNIFICLVSDNDGDAIAFNVTAYYGVAGLLTDITTEANSQVYPRFTFTAKELGSYVSANTIATSATTVTLMDNGAASAVTVSYNAAQTGLKNDSVNTTEITSGTDEIDYRVVTPNTSGSLTFTWMGILGDTSAVTTVSTLPSLALLGLGM